MGADGVKRLRPLGPVLGASVHSALGATLLVTLPIAGVIDLLDARDLEAHPLPLWPFFVIFGAVWLYGLLRIKVDISDKGVVVRNIWRAYSLRWDQVREVSDRGGWRSPLAWLDWFSMLVITTTDGRRIVVQASLGWVPDENVRNSLREAIPAGEHVEWRMSFREEWESE